MKNRTNLIHLTLLICYSLLVFISACAKPNYYKSNGVSYFEKPEKELSGIIRIKDPDELNMLCDDGVVIDSMLYIATATSKKQSDNETSRIAIYRINPSDAAIQDSLIVSEKNRINRMFPVENSGTLFLPAIKWSQETGHLFILRANAELNKYETFDYDVTGLSIQQVTSSGKYLYVLLISDKRESHLVRVRIETMKVENTSLISRNPITCYLYNGKVYTLEKTGKGIKIIQTDINNPEKILFTRDFSINLASNLKEDERRYTMYVDENYIYLLYRKSFTNSEQGEGTFSITKFNIKDNTSITSDFKGALFDLVNAANQLILFKSDYRQSYKKSINYLVPVLSQLSNDLSSEKELVAYLPSVYNYAFKVVPVSESKVAMIGTYQSFTKDNNANLFSPYIAFFDLK